MPVVSLSGIKTYWDRFLVTGGLGYIGSHTCVQMIEQGMQQIILDNLCNANPEVLNRIETITGTKPIFYVGDVRDSKILGHVFNPVINL